MRIGRWHVEDGVAVRAFATHLHGRDLEVASDPVVHGWRWWVRSPHGAVLADGVAADLETAEQAAEDEALAVHPPTAGLLERLLE
jgi:hypothetical protein